MAVCVTEDKEWLPQKIKLFRIVILLLGEEKTLGYDITEIIKSSVAWKKRIWRVSSLPLSVRTGLPELLFTDSRLKIKRRE